MNNPLRNSGVLFFVLVVLAGLMREAGAQVIADHRAVAAFDSIPSEWIDSVKCMLLIMPGESHGRGYCYGMELLEAQDAIYASSVTWSGTPETYTASHVRTSRPFRYSTRWSDTGGEQAFYTNASARSNMVTGLTYTRSNYSGKIAFGFGWCWDMTWTNSPGGTVDPVYGCRWAGSSVSGPEGDLRWGLDPGDQALTGNSVCMQTYLDAVDLYNGSEPNITTFFTTGPVDGNHGTENGYQRWVKHEFIRDYVAVNGGYLFDYADILCWDDGMQYMDSWDGHDFQNGDPDLASGGTGYDGGDGGCHISEDGCLALGKAMWWMLARIAGWDGTTGGTPTTATPVISPSGGIHEVSVSVSISCATGGATIHYTTDGSLPDSTDTEYTGAFTLTADATVRAIAYADGYAASGIDTETFTITTDVSTPVISPAGGTHEEEATVSISCATSGANIYYTTDGSVPDDADTEYTGAFTLTADATVQAIAYKTGLTASGIDTAVFTITQDTDPPVLESAFTQGAATVTAMFDCGLDATTAADEGNYALDNGISVTAAVLQPNGTSVALTVSPDLETGVTYTLTVNGVEDLDGNAASGERASFTLSSAVDSCVACYTFDEGSGDTAYDGSGNGYNGGINTATWTIDAVSGYALQFDGDDTVDIGDDRMGIQTSGAFTVSLWFKYTGTFNGHMVARGQYITPFRIFADGSSVRTCVRTAEGTDYLTGDSTVQAGIWYHYAFTYTDGFRTGYLNGGVDQANTPTGDATVWSSNHTWFGPGFTGMLDEIRIYDRALTQAEVRTLYASGDVPVELTSFTAAIAGDGVRLEWSTATETGNLGWHVFRSTDGGAFERITPGIVPGQGTTAVPQDYSYLDEAVPAGAREVSYYLEQHDLNGGTERSATVSAALTVSEIGPSVSADASQLPFELEWTTAALTVRWEPGTGMRLTLYGTDGSAVAAVPYMTGGEAALSIRSVPAGLYLLQLEREGGTHTVKVTIVK